ncbi:MAG: tetratricopeptide repeat protein [Thermoplasmatota archaeon]
MNSRALVLVILACAPLAAAAPSGAAVQDLEGHGAVVSAAAGILRARAPGSTWTLAITGDVEVQVIDDHFDVLQAPIPPPAGPVKYHDRAQDAWRSHSAGHVQLVDIDQDAVLLALPVQAAVQVETQGSWRARADVAQRLEESHAFTANSTAPYYYAYQTPDAANWTTTAPATWTAVGTFEIYAWGLTFTVHDAQGERTIRTGAWTTEEGRFGHREHNAFAVLRVDGELRGELAGDQDLHAEEIHVESRGPVEFVGQGVVHAGGATYALDGPATLQGGAYHVSRAEHGLVLDVQDAQHVRGAGVARLDVDAGRVLVLVAGVLAAAIFLFVAFGLSARWGWLGNCTTWLDRAAWAVEAGHLRWAAFCARTACLLDPERGEAVFVRAQIRADRGRLEGALRDYKAAYGILPDVEKGVAAFEASRLEALAGRAMKAADWLLKALDHDPGLLQRAQLERDFEAVLREPAFRDPVAGRFGLGATR